MTISAKRDGDRWLLEGVLDEFVDYAPLAKTPSPLKLDLRGLKAINSHGMREWIKFIGSTKGKTLEIYNCPSVFLVAVDLVPDVASPTGDLATLKSCRLEFTCPRCVKDFSLELGTEKIRANPRLVLEEPRSCPRCKLNLTQEFDAEMYITLFEA